MIICKRTSNEATLASCREIPFFLDVSSYQSKQSWKSWIVAVLIHVSVYLRFLNKHRGRRERNLR